MSDAPRVSARAAVSLVFAVHGVVLEAWVAQIPPPLLGLLADGFGLAAAIGAIGLALATVALFARRVVGRDHQGASRAAAAS